MISWKGKLTLKNGSHIFVFRELVMYISKSSHLEKVNSTFKAEVLQYNYHFNLTLFKNYIGIDMAFVCYKYVMILAVVSGEYWINFYNT